MMPWESKAQYRRWNKDTYKPHSQANHLIDQFHTAERKARSIRQSRHLSLHRVARIGWVRPSHRNGPHSEHLVGHHHPQTEGGALMPGDLQRSGQLGGPLEDDGAELSDQPTGFLRDPPTYEEALQDLGRAPTEADLGPRSPELCSSSLMPYDVEEDGDQDETQEQQEGILEQMETEEQDIIEAPIKRGIGIKVAPEKYQPASPRYIRAGEDSGDEEDGQDKEEDLEAPYLAPKPALFSGPAQSEKSVWMPAAGDTAPAEDLSDPESIPELIDLREEGERLSPFPSQKAQCPTMLKLPALIFPPLEGQKGNDQEVVIGICQEKVPEEQIIYIDDDRDPSPLQLLEKQVDSLLMLPPADCAPKARKTPRSLGQGLQLSKMSDNEEQSPGAVKKRMLQGGRNAKPLKLKTYKVAKMCTGPVDTLRTQELIKLTSAVVPLQRLKIQDDPVMKTQEDQSETKTPAPPQK